ncbi:MAG: hypothetical protein IT446_14905 [Phycisphaerales bacterium]|nr:hypothetical protein [Phycisphaerales bacterium]
MTLLLERLSRQLNCPGSEYRGQLFWAWNGDLQPDELRRQIRIMHRMGLGGFFMHARMGLQTQYLGDEWFECVRASVDEARQLGMRAWVYDEDQFPSGCAAGLVTENPEYRMRRLELSILADDETVTWDEAVVAAFSAVLLKGRASQVRQLAKGENAPAGPGHSLLVFRCRIADAAASGTFRRHDNNIYGSSTVPYLDTLNPEAVRAFVASTYDQYLLRHKSDFGKTIPGIFTDEPYFGEVFSPHYKKDDLRVPWTDALPRTFKQRYGYDLVANLVELFYTVDGKDVSAVRYDFYDCLTHLFVESFAKQIGEWCERAGVAFTGHVLFESLLSHQAHAVGSAMRFYEHMQLPGMDLLCNDREFDSAIQVASAARQFGRRRRLTETYGCTGWQLPFESHKAIGDWQMALGINMRCLHLGFYSMEGESKRDYPASILHQSPWWECYPTVEDYFARIGAVMTRGEEVRDLLVISPVESAWAIMKPHWMHDAAIRKLDRSMVRVRDALLAGNIGFDYGDEDIMSRHGAVTGTAGEARLQLGKASYTMVLLPPMLTIRSSTVKLLEEFVRAGGKVVVVGDAAAHVDARPSDAAARLARMCDIIPFNRGGMVRAVERCRRVSIADNRGRQIGPALHLLREDADAYYLFVCNYGAEFTDSTLVWHKNKGPCHEPLSAAQRDFQCQDVRIRVNGVFAGAMEVDCSDGKLYRADTASVWGALEIRTSLEKNGSRLFVLPKHDQPLNLPRRAVNDVLSSRKLHQPAYSYELSEPNNLVLDCPEFRIDGGRWNKSKDVLQVDDIIRKRLGLEPRGWLMRQPWQMKESTNGESSRSIEVELRYSFRVDHVPSGDLHLAMERPDIHAISVNGRDLPTDESDGWWVDASLKKIPMPPRLLKIGDNQIALRCRYDPHHGGLEAIYLLGDFAVKPNGRLVSMCRLASTLTLGDWTEQGLMFYSGSVKYLCPLTLRCQETKRYIVNIPAHQGVAVRIWLNDQPIRVVGWAPWTVDITDHLDGSTDAHVLGVEIIGHRGNSHGPLHADRMATLRQGIGPYSFRKSGKEWKQEYQLIPCGLMQPVELTTVSRTQDDTEVLAADPQPQGSIWLNPLIAQGRRIRPQHKNEKKYHKRIPGDHKPVNATPSR